MDNITAKQFLQSSPAIQAEYLNLFQFVRKTNKFGAPELLSMTWGQVAQIKRLAAKDDLAAILEMVCDGWAEYRVKEFIPFIGWLNNQIAGIYEREKLLADSDVVRAAKMKQAGADRLNQFGDFNVNIALAKEYGIDPEDIDDWRYSKVFTILYHGKISNQVQEAYFELTKNDKYS